MNGTIKLKILAENFLNFLCSFCFLTYTLGGYSIDGDHGLSYITDLFNLTSICVFLGFAFGLDLGQIFIFQGFNNFQTFLQKKEKLKLPGMFILICLSLFLMSFYIVPIIRHHSFSSYFWDLAVMEQVIWRRAFGYGLTSTAITNQFNPPLDFLWNQHLNFWLIPISFLYRLFPHTETLLILQSTALLLAFVPLWKISREFLPRWIPPILFPAFFWMWNTIHKNNVWDIHEACYLPLFSFWAYYFFLKRKWLYVGLFTLVIALFKEDAWVLAGAMAFYFFSANKKFFLAVFAFLVGFGIFVVYGILCDKVIPLSDRYAYLGNSFSEALPIISHNPFVFFQHLVTPGPLLFLVKVLTVTGGLWLLGGWAIIAIIPNLFECALSTNPGMYSFDYHYAIAFSGPLFFSAFMGLNKLDSLKISINKKKMILYGATAIALSQLFYSEPVQIKNYLQSKGWKTRQCYLALLNHVPVDATVYSQDPLVSHLSSRPLLFFNYNVKSYLPNSIIVEPAGTTLPPGFFVVQQACGQMIASNFRQSP